MKNVIVQCELWCEGSLRRIGRVCSRRSRHVSIQDTLDVCPGRAMQLGPCGPRICGSGVEISIRQCPLKHTKSSQTCPASKPTPGCGSNITAGYVLYPSPGGPFDNIPTKLSASECSEETTMLTPESDAFSTSPYNSSSKDVPYSESQQPIQPPLTFEKKTLPNFRSLHMFGSTPTVIVARETNSSVTGRPKVQPQSSWTTQTRNIYSSRTPIVTTDQMTDWHSMMVSIMWNIQAWKTWIHNSIKKVLTFQENSEWVPGWRQPGPVWVISACGAVPSAAVSAGVCDGEDTWVARTTHNCKILPAALYPSMHCCVLYHGGRIYHYTKYQVLCNAPVLWLAWRAGSVPERAVRVGAVYVGRVRYRASYLLGAVTPPRYRCHVVMFGRPVAFDCFELLLLDVAT
ncbi:hypothetical protein RR48_08820 [Papilio machaon]|uniref:Uncharacterized protein n=1 Tax=Papilio machaon TaxID=76193 RepID=A0A194QVL9_PAPMA|nr:hypothetical protein RR48_08820 [Papilio machaon]